MRLRFRAAARALTAVAFCLLLALGSRAPGSFSIASTPQQTRKQRPSQLDPDALTRIKDQAFNHSQLLPVLSYVSDIAGPRLTGSPGLRQAEEWIKSRLEEWGLANPHLEPWGPFGRGWSLTSFSASMIRPRFSPLIAYAKAWSPGTGGPIRGEPVYFDATTDAELRGFEGKLQGRIVLISRPRELKPHFEPLAHRLSDQQLLKLANLDPSESHSFQVTSEQKAAQELLNKKWKMAYRQHAALVLSAGYSDGGVVYVTSATPDPSVKPSAISSDPDIIPPWSANSPPVLPQAVLAAEQYNRITRLIGAGIPVELEVNVGARFYDDDLMSCNVIADLPGGDLSGQVVILGGCVDSWHAGTGATDNAAGVAVCMEALRILKELGLHPRRTIRLGLWSGEEQGRLGSRAYVARHFAERSDPAERPDPTGSPNQLKRKPEYEKLWAAFDLDDGTGKIRGIYLQGHEAARPIFSKWLAPLKDLGASTLTIAGFNVADNYSFEEAGLPGFFFLRDEIEYGRYAHTNMDVFDRIQEDDLKQAAAVVAWIVYNAAMCDERITPP